MSAQSKAVNKLKQFGIVLDTNKIGTQQVWGKRSSYDPNGPFEKADKEAFCYDVVYEHLKGKHATSYTVSDQRYSSNIYLDLQNEADYQGEREWYGVENFYFQFTLTHKLSGKSQVIKITPNEGGEYIHY